MAQIDAALATLAHRHTVPAAEVADILLDLRTQILLGTALAELCDISE